MVDLNRQAELREAIELFFFGYRAFTAPPDRLLEAWGLGRVHHRVLYFVARQPGITVTELQGVLGVSKQALNGPLRQVAEAGLVGSAADASDKRVRRLHLTDKGGQLEAALTGTQVEMLEKVFAQLGADTELAWKQVMQALAVPPEA
ncbi:MarR family winged helix-turn-helix transcriptional regulator [Zoogloea sp. 1C4]|uniref:MarR family winged helix-turn-helix transcriptional regulator n=1 Tax=Zoogloea sp. 1C4 TaxID=2570190 RepID=UPI0012926A43|nr:MarR family transcriptional regulator [Zoogloea sp. 1C4]